MCGIYRREADFAYGRLDQLLRENFISGNLGHYPVAGQNSSIGGDDDAIAFAVHRFHAVAADLERAGVGITEISEVVRAPTRTHRIASIIEEAGSPFLRQADDGHTRHC